jgi:hypothetical protein
VVAPDGAVIVVVVRHVELVALHHSPRFDGGSHLRTTSQATLFWGLPHQQGQRRLKALN